MTEKERLLSLIEQAEKEFPNMGRPILDIEEYVAEYLLANGIVVLPCKIGSTVYYFRPIPCKICPNRIERDCTYIKCPKQICTKSFTLSMKNKIGKTLFLTYNEAEKELEKYKYGRID